ncbi:hypothetical protein DB347_12955 [Opitutaceae bacterium EW11]|nr:hypothetical protein DB347_12955 [Opitutaceae bacterium EW11]
MEKRFELGHGGPALCATTMSSPTDQQTREEQRREPHEHPRNPPPKEDVPGRTGSDGAKSGWRKRPLLVGLGALVLIALVVAGVLYWIHSRGYEKTDDAFVDVVAERVSARIPGRISKVLVNDNQDVVAGQTVVLLDPADYQARRDQAASALAQAEAAVAQARADESVRRAQLEQAKASRTAAEASRVQAQADVERYRKLHESGLGAVALEQVDRAEAAARTTAAQEDAAARAVAAAAAQVGFAQSQIEAAQAGVKSATAQLRQAELNLSYADVKARTSGRVAGRSAAEGNYVEPGMQLMAIVPRAVYVTANFKETQLDRMHPGQPVDVVVDAYPELKLHGRVDSIQPAAGQAFSVLPAQNATGNWVKVVQRVPVKIALDELPEEPYRRLGPGMSVSVRVSVR